MNQIINMIMRQVTNRLIRKGLDVGFDKAATLGKGRAAPQRPVDEYGNEIPSQGPTQAEVRAARQAKKAARQHRQKMKALKRISKF